MEQFGGPFTIFNFQKAHIILFFQKKKIKFESKKCSIILLSKSDNEDFYFNFDYSIFSEYFNEIFDGNLYMNGQNWPYYIIKKISKITISLQKLNEQKHN